MARTATESPTNNIRKLRSGESFSISGLLTLEEAAGDTSPQEALKLMRNRINPVVGRLRTEMAGSTFRVDSASALTDDKNAILLTVAVTRTDDNDVPNPNEDDEEVDI